MTVEEKANMVKAAALRASKILKTKITIYYKGLPLTSLGSGEDERIFYIWNKEVAREILKQEYGILEEVMPVLDGVLERMGDGALSGVALLSMVESPEDLEVLQAVGIYTDLGQEDL